MKNSIKGVAILICQNLFLILLLLLIILLRPLQLNKEMNSLLGQPVVFNSSGADISPLPSKDHESVIWLILLNCWQTSSSRFVVCKRRTAMHLYPPSSAPLRLLCSESYDWMYRYLSIVAAPPKSQRIKFCLWFGGWVGMGWVAWRHLG